MLKLRLSWGRAALGACLCIILACDGESTPAKYGHLDASVMANPDGGVVDAGGATPDGGTMDAGSQLDAGSDAGHPVTMTDAGSDAGMPEVDAGHDASTPAHPLAGHYAVRSVLFARQKTEVNASPGDPPIPLDVVSKGVLLSVADVDAAGVVSEHYCFLEIINEQGIFSWTRQVTAEAIPDSVVKLSNQDGQFVRSEMADRTYVSWSPDKKPADCVPGQKHPSGCACPEDDGLPTRPDDCRVFDLEGDGTPGGRLYLATERPLDPEMSEGLVRINIASTKAIGWELPAPQGARVVGKLHGGIDQQELSREGDASSLFGRIRNAVCPDQYSHVELVRGDFSCAAILASRKQKPDVDDIFDPSLDATPPDATECPDPDCHADTDHDGKVDCEDGCPLDKNKLAPGACGCGTADTNRDGDAQPDCTDECDDDPSKVAAGQCGCGVPETDSDHDSTPDCTDGCVNDPAKSAPGICGCGVPDTNTDGDSQPDCSETCDTDPNKLAPGVCGCGVADTNTDHDSQPDCNETCDTDPNKLAPGLCGCGVPDTNTDGDSQPDCSETCDTDPNKLAPGVCGCGVPDTNTDHDSQPDCNETCDTDPNKLAPGLCGCGVPDTNTDGDSQPDCNETCDADPNKLAPGLCGCGTPDTNTDGDSQPDCNETCDADPNKLAPGICGCGIPDKDLNGDGTIDCSDTCPNDPAKVAPGLCGCGVPDTNTDGDSQPDCKETCDTDPNKLAPGQCGCGVADTDSDGDGVANCNDACPSDPLKTTLGLCGCGVPDTNTDGDSQPDCTDQCDNDPSKTAPGACGCGVPDTNTDGDSQPDCIDQCDNDPSKTAPGACGCGVPDTNSDGDALPDCTDQCDNDPNKTVPGTCGCGVPEGSCTTNTLPGTYAVRSILYTKAKSGSTTSGSKAVNYSLVTITSNTDGTLHLSDKSCYTETQPITGTTVYSWSRSSWVQAIPAVERTLVDNGNGTWTRQGALSEVGWKSANQPATCSASSTPVGSDWLSSWGTTCKCNAPAANLPPFSKTTPYDCRVVDLDKDGYPGLSAYASTSAPAGPDSDPSGALSWARLMVVSKAYNTWTITPAADGHHKATVFDSSQPAVVGCVGGGLVSACTQVSSNPVNTVCPQQYNTAVFVPTAAATTCSSIVTNRATLFAGVNDGSLPNDTICPPP